MHGLNFHFHLIKSLCLAAVMAIPTSVSAAERMRIPPHEPAKFTASNIDSIKSLSWLKGHWTAKGPKGSVHLNAKSVGNNQYIYLTFDDDKDTVSELQVLGFSPKAKTVISWSFDGNGGFGKSIWKQEGNDWLVRSIAANPNGKSGVAKYLLHKIDDNNFTWKSTGRIFDGKRIPDTSEVTVTRDQKGVN